MYKIILLVLAFAGLSFFTYQTLQDKSARDSFELNPHTQFAIKDINTISKVFLADRSGNQALVEKISDDQWKYTNKSTGQNYIANPSAIHSLLQTLVKIRTREPVSKAAEENVIKSIAAKSTKVEVYDDQNQLIKVYYVGPMAGSATGNYMIMEGSEQPYINYIPNFQGTVDTRYITTEEDWRDKAFVRTLKDEIEYISMAYQDPTQANESFKINMNNGLASVEAIDPSTKEIESGSINIDNVDTYLEDFETIFAEKILYNKPLRDSILTTRPFAIVRYKARYHNEAQTFRLYSLYNPKADRGDGQAGHRQKIQRYFVDINENNFFLAQHLVIRKILWGYSFFFKANNIDLEEDEAETIIKYPDNKELDRE